MWLLSCYGEFVFIFRCNAQTTGPYQPSAVCVVLGHTARAATPGKDALFADAGVVLHVLQGPAQLQDGGMIQPDLADGVPTDVAIDQLRDASANATQGNIAVAQDSQDAQDPAITRAPPGLYEVIYA